MKLNFVQAITSALVAFAAGAAITFALHGAIGRGAMETIATLAIVIGASRLVDTK
ncbi:hypothetical protein HZY97_04790 [Sphingomonas sp. R-74633]|uniref:hypothetical protein n=1 Tax=Sphingomonas sp. R-74633 TaxID=2751188 RepID=UPI0015D335C7|nr:hypothetical protein [Sphingomonas sp. R-74633]NYT40062.1 hypothetical protein [Sphingomonas sp. R-74633]